MMTSVWRWRNSLLPMGRAAGQKHPPAGQDGPNCRLPVWGVVFQISREIPGALNRILEGWIPVIPAEPRRINLFRSDFQEIGGPGPPPGSGTENSPYRLEDRAHEGSLRSSSTTSGAGMSRGLPPRPRLSLLGADIEGLDLVEGVPKSSPVISNVGAAGSLSSGWISLQVRAAALERLSSPPAMAPINTPGWNS